MTTTSSKLGHLRNLWMVLLIPLSLIAVSFFARDTARRAWNSLVQYKTPYVFSNPHATSAPPLVSHVYVVVVDGLRSDVSRDMSFLNELRSRGADVLCTVGLPSLSLPGRAVLMTGAWQEVNGQMTNFNPRALPIETLFQAARKKNLTTALAAGRNPQKMFAPFVNEKVIFPTSGDPETRTSIDQYASDFHPMAAATRDVIRHHHPNFFLMDYTVTDRVAHDFGGASSEYRQAAKWVDDEIRNLAGVIDFSDSVLIVTSDHGHVDRGGHGGDEPEVLTVPWVMAGKSIRPGVVVLAQQVDVAPTVAALLGTEIPADNEGRILIETLQVDGPGQVSLLRELYQQRKNFTENYLAVVGGTTRMTAPETPDDSSLAAMENDLDQLDEIASAAKEARTSSEPAARLKWAVLIVLLPVAGLVLYLFFGWIHLRDLFWGLLSVVIYWPVYFALFSIAHLGYSFSAVNREEQLGAFLGKDMGFAVIAFAIAVAVGTGLRRRRYVLEPGDRLETGFSSFGILIRFPYVAAALVALSILIKIAFTYWRFGLFARWYVPNMHWGFGEYLDLLQLVALGLAACLAPLAAWVGILLISRPKEAVNP